MNIEFGKNTINEIFVAFLNADFIKLCNESVIDAFISGDYTDVLKALGKDQEGREKGKELYKKELTLIQILFLYVKKQKQDNSHVWRYLDYLNHLKSVMEEYVESPDQEIFNMLPKSHIEMTMDCKLENGELKYTYKFELFEDLIIYGLFAFISDETLTINTCKNCGKHFHPNSRSDEIYCGNIFEGRRTCKEMGYMIKVESDEYKKAYRKAYKNQNANKQRKLKNDPTAEKKFKSWINRAKQKQAEAESGIISLSEFEEWLKEGM